MTFSLTACVRAWPAAVALAAALIASSAASAQQTLTLADALNRAAAADPAAPGNLARIQAAEAGVRQADVRPNPVIGVDVEDVAGTGPYSLLDRSQTTVYYEQSIERGGKRQARVGVARAELSAAGLRREVRLYDRLAAVQTAWAEAAASEASVALAEEKLALAKRASAEVRRRVQAARDPLFAYGRTHTQVAEAEIAVEQAQLAASSARAVLASYWGGPSAFRLDLEEFGVLALPQIAAGAAPADVGLLQAEREIAAARVQLEQSRAVQDPRWRAGLRHVWDGHDTAVIVGGSIPLGRYDTNQGAIDRATAERRAADADITAAAVDREREIARLTARMAARIAEVRRIDKDVLPRAGATIDLVREGFNRGGFSYIDVVEAQRVLADAKGRRIEALKAFHTDKAALDRLTGRHAGLILAAAETR